ncbi:YKL069W [Zygosaccharomyces parabailii]|nr:YKL069W [Zygosaccharomyces parabailii]CDH18007.1 probable Free methionine-R-sulfoxide reductase [Zygosaccharomyces bailii ISA1307]
MGEHHADFTNFETSGREEALALVLQHYEALTTNQDNWVCNLANASSLLWHAYHSLQIPVNWAGFYVSYGQEELLLGPFQGKVACQTIQFGNGVCGKAAAEQATQVVRDVNKEPDHIACDGETKSEIVVPVVSNGKTLAVIDIDCLDYDAFGPLDQYFLERLSKLISKTCKF